MHRGDAEKKANFAEGIALVIPLLKKKLTGMNFSHGGRLAQPVWPDGAIRCGLLFPLHALFLPRNVLGIFFWSRVMLNFKFYCRFSLTLKGLKREIIN